MIRATYGTSIIKTINDMYRENFINFEIPYMLERRGKGEGVMVGEFTNIGAATYTNNPSHIFNAGNALILTNQVSFAFACVTDMIDAGQGVWEASRLVLTEANIKCAKIINEASSKTFILENNAAKIDDSGRKWFSGKLDLSAGAFVIKVQGIITRTNKHALPS